MWEIGNSAAQPNFKFSLPFVASISGEVQVPDVRNIGLGLGFLFEHVITGAQASDRELRQAVAGKIINAVTNGFEAVLSETGRDHKEKKEPQDDDNSTKTKAEKDLEIAKEVGDRAAEGRAYRNLGYAYVGLQQFHEAIESHQHELEIFQELKDKSEEMRANRNLGIVYCGLCEFDKAKTHHGKELEVAKDDGDRAAEGRAYRNLGYTYVGLKQFHEAIESHQHELEIFQELNHKSEEGRANENLGVVYQSLCEFHKAKMHYDKELEIAQEVGDRAREGRAYSNLGQVYRSLREFDKAKTHHGKELEVAKEDGDRAAEGRAYRNLGYTYVGLKQFHEAIKSHQHELEIFQELTDKSEEGRANENLGVVYQSLCEFHKAKRHYDKELEIAQEVGDRAREGRAHRHLGTAFHGLKQFDGAIQSHQQERKIFHELKDKSEEGRAYGNLGMVYQSRRDFDNAKRHHEQELNFAKECRNTHEEGEAQANLGNVFTEIRQLKEAIDCFEKKRRISKSLDDKIGEGRANAYLCIAHQIRSDDGDRDKADKYLEESLEITDQDWRFLVDIDLRVGQISLERGEYRRAIMHFEHALKIAKGKRLPGVSCNPAEEEVNKWLGKTYVNIGDYERAREHFDEQLRIAKEIEDNLAVGRAKSNLGSVYRNMPGYFVKGLKYMQEGRKIAEDENDRLGEGIACKNLGMAYHSIGDFEKSKELHNRHLMISQMLEDTREEGKAFANLGNVCRCLRNFQQAQVYHQKSLKIAKENKCKVEKKDALYLLGRDFECVGSLPDALQYYRSSMEIYVSLRDDLLFQDEWKISFRERQKPMYTALLRTLLNLQLTDEALFVAEHGKAQDLRDRLESRSGYRVPKAFADMSRLVRNIPTQIAFFALGSDEIYFWVLNKGEKIHFRQMILTNAAFLSLENYKKDAYSAIKADDPGAKKPELTTFTALYDRILGPIEDLLQRHEQEHKENKRDLVIIPDGPLNFVPFAALLDHENKALGDSYRIRIFPSLTSLKVITHDRSEDQDCNVGALLVGNPQGNLEHAEDEVRDIKQIIETTGQNIQITTLIQEGATKEAVSKKMTSVALIHIAAHGSSDSIFLAETKHAFGRNFLSKKDVQKLHLKAKLVVLSCCNTGQGDVNEEGVIGIARAFLCAGARAVLASLWQVKDDATKKFMTCFYQHLLQEQKGAAEAYQLAMKDLRETEEFKSTKFWAPFILIGDDVSLRFCGK